LSKIRKITENGVIFRSPRDGQTIDLTERSIEIQNALGADVIMAFDECPPYPANREEIKPQLLGLAGWSVVLQLISGLTKHCLELCRGVYLDLRSDAAQSLAKLICLGMQWRCECGRTPVDCQIVRATAPATPEKPRYLMGVGTYREMAQAIAGGFV